MHLIHRKTCRICGSPELTPVINLGEQYLQGSFIKPEKPAPAHRKIPLSLVRCDPSKDENACGLLQMAHSVPPEILYSTYWYRSGTNATMRKHLQGVVDSAIGFLAKVPERVLDIGCNDGTLLGFYPKKTRKFGIDPSDISKQINKADVDVIHDFFPSSELVLNIGQDKFDVITSIAMFYDLEDPVAFAVSIKEILAPDGIWVFETSYMPAMLQMNSYDTICHEHLEYYSLAVIEFILARSGLKVFNAERNSINGGSLRCYATHDVNFAFRNDQFSQNLYRLHQEEFDLELDTNKPYLHFQDRINVHREELLLLIKQLRNDGKRIHIYGASTKGNVILQWCGIDHHFIDFAAERNPEKFGATTLGTGIPIISEIESRAKNPDFYLVLPWHFREEIVKREREILRKGTGLIFPLPAIEIISASAGRRRRLTE